MTDAEKGRVVREFLEEQRQELEEEFERGVGMSEAVSLSSSLEYIEVLKRRAMHRYRWP
jgi:hypothetical protein